MTKLKCNVGSCEYNQEYCCCLNGIEVGGPNATDKENTCCENFVKKSGSMTNCNMCKNPTMEVGCEATNCVYNCDCKCDADEICICGERINGEHGTECHSFKCK